MDYLNRLSKTDVESICKLIGSRDLKQNFRANSNGFSIIKPGFRPNTISNEEAVALTVQNVSMRFISKFLNEKIQSLMDKIIGEQENLIAKGIPSDDARVIALANSPFFDNLDLYFRLEQPVRSSEEISALKIAIRIAKRVYKPNLVEDTPTDPTIKLLKEELEAQKEYAHNKIQQVQDLLKETQTSLQAAVEDATRLRNEKDELKNELDLEEKELTRYRALEKYSIGHRLDSADAKYPFKSICKVFWADGYMRLKRLSDIQHDEVIGGYLEEFPMQRDLFSDQKSGTFPEGYVGVWDWHVIPNKKDPSRDFIETSYSSSQPTQIIIFKECDSVEKIIKKLTAGVSEKIYCEGVLFAYWNGKKYEGIYCHPKDLDVKIDRISLKQDVFRLPVFEVFASMLYQTGDCQVCTVLNFGMPTKVINVKDSMDVLKALLRKRLTWATSKQRGITNATHQQITAYLQELPNKDFVQELAMQCNCTEDEANELIRKFVQDAGSYLSATDIEDEMLSRIIQQNSELEERCKELLTTEWEKENSEKIQRLENELMQRKNASKDERIRLEQLTEKYEAVERKLKESNEKLEEREQLAAEVEQKVAERIAKAQKDAADFIAAQAFLPQINRVGEKQTVSTTVFSSFASGKSMEDRIAVLKNPDDVVEYLADNLKEAGVQENYTRGLAAYLYSAYRYRTPVLLAGPNGLAIAQAFSTTLFSRTVAILSCVGDYTEKVCKECEKSEDDVVAIMNPFCAGWTQQLPTAVFDSGKFFFLLSPYAEDLQVEPMGISNYVLPLMTEFLVDKKPSSVFVGGELSPDFDRLPMPKVRPIYKNFLTSLGYSTLAKKNLWSVFANMESMMKGGTSDTVGHRYLFGLLPFAIIAGKANLLMEQFEKDESKPSKNICTIIHEYLGGEE